MHLVKSFHFVFFFFNQKRNNIDNSKVQKKDERFFPQNIKPNQSKTILLNIKACTKYPKN